MVTLARVNNTTFIDRSVALNKWEMELTMIQMWCPKQILLVTDFYIYFHTFFSPNLAKSFSG